MNNTYIIGALVAIIIIGGGAWMLTNGTSGSGTVATSTTQGTNDTSTPQPSATPATPWVSTGTLVVASNSGAVVTGKIIPNGAQTTYWYEYGPTSALGASTIAQSIGSGSVSISAPVFISGLSANASYSYRLVAQNVLGTARGATYSFTTNSNPAPVGGAPTVSTNAATTVTRTSATINGHVSPNLSDTSYWFEYGTSNDLGNTTDFQGAGNGNVTTSRSATISNLQPQTTYYFRIDAQNAFGTVNSTIQSFTTGGPANPTAPSADTTNATNITTSAATANGQVNPHGAATTYWFEYSTDSLLGHILGSTTHQTVAGSGTSVVMVSANLTGLARNTNYSYRLVTSNNYGTTDGDIVSFKTNSH